MTDATRTIVGVSEVLPNPRDAAIAAIAERANQQKEESGDFAEFNEETGEVAPKKEPEKAPEKAPETEEAPPEGEDKEEGEKAEPEPPKAEEEAEKQEELVTLRVDGKEVQVPKSKIVDAGVRTLQKEAAADKRLEEATRLLKAAQEFSQKQQPMQQPLSDQDVAHVIAQALRTGDEAQASAAIQALMQSGRSQPIPDVRQVVAQEFEATAALDMFKRDFADIVSDPTAMLLASSLEDQRIARVQAGAEPNRPLSEVYKEHGESIRKWRGIGQKSMQEKAELKKALQPAPVAASVRAPAPKPDKPKTTEQIIEDMRKSRHQRIA